jgi:hypothetical protein
MAELDTDLEMNSLSLTDNIPTEVFCGIWQEMGIYDYEEIKKFAIGNTELIPVLNSCLYRVDIDGNKSNFTSESLVKRLQILFDKSPYLKEVNLLNLSIRDINVLLSFPKIKSVTNLHIDNVDYNTTYSVFERMIELRKQYGEDFMFEVYHTFDEKEANSRDIHPFPFFNEDEDSYQIKYDHGTFMYDNINLDFVRLDGAKQTEVSDWAIEPSYLSQVVQQLRPHTIETYGAEITTALMACDSIENINIKEYTEEGIDRESVSFEVFIIANEEYMNAKYPDKADQINSEEDEDGNVLTEEEMRELGMQPTLELKNCSVTSISYLSLPSDEDFSVTEPYNYVYSTITDLLVPINIDQLRSIIEAYSIVKTFYYYYKSSSVSHLDREVILRELIRDYPDIEFKSVSELER